MRTFAVLFAALALAACGGSDSKTADAKPAGIDSAPGTPDAPAGTPDAAGAGVTGLGQVCDPTKTGECPASAPQCIGIQQGVGFCSLKCATTTWTAGAMAPANPPQTANQACTGAYTGASGTGTPACALYGGMSPATDTQTDFFCGLECGTFQTMQLGTCPTGLSCQLQQGQTYGICG